MSPIAEISTVCYVGAGTMGSVNSLVAAIAGYEVVVYDIDAAALERVHGRQREFADFMMSVGFCTGSDVEHAWPRIRTTPDPGAAAGDADLVSESVIESLDVKRDVHRQFDRLCPPHTILTTNTSALLVSEIEDAVERGERFAALHSHLGSTLVDIVGGPRTAPGVVDVLRRYVLSLGAVPLVLQRETPGYVVNALLGPLLMTGADIVVRGFADVHTVDASWMSHDGAAMGPFAMIDMFGVDMVLHNWRQPNREDTPFRAQRRAQTVPLLQRVVDQGRHGMKTSGGFYDYPDPAYQGTGFLDLVDPTIQAHLVSAVTVRAAQLAGDGVADERTIDHAWTTATSLPRGPFGVIDQIGWVGFLEMSSDLAAAGLVGADDATRAQRYVASRNGESPKTPVDSAE
jgi:3-hydroxybutyryl-CoA dehydrogenase